MPHVAIAIIVSQTPPLELLTLRWCPCITSSSLLQSQTALVGTTPYTLRRSVANSSCIQNIQKVLVCKLAVVANTASRHASFAYAIGT